MIFVLLVFVISIWQTIIVVASKWDFNNRNIFKTRLSLLDVVNLVKTNLFRNLKPWRLLIKLNNFLVNSNMSYYSGSKIPLRQIKSSSHILLYIWSGTWYSASYNNMYQGVAQFLKFLAIFVFIRVNTIWYHQKYMCLYNKDIVKICNEYPLTEYFCIRIYDFFS